jgi:hypothetical protein
MEKKLKCNETVPQIFIYFNEAYDSVRKEVLYNILMEFGVLMKIWAMTFNRNEYQDSSWGVKSSWQVRLDSLTAICELII